MRKRNCLLAVPALLALLSFARTAASQATTRPEVPASFMRFVDDGQGGGSLQTAVVSFTNPAGVEVDLVTAIHIGEKSYYDGLNQDFKNYDAVLYEMVKPRDMAPPTPGEVENSDNPITAFQRFLKNTLELDFQLDDIDYTAPNFIHADLDKETFERLQEERGETFEQIMMRMIIKSFEQSSATTQPADDFTLQDAIKLLTRPDMDRQIKVVIAKQLGQIDLSAMGLDGPNGSVILTERNKAAFAVLDQTISDGKKKIAIFYGGAHMPDMSKRLESRGFSPTDIHWNLAWDLHIRADAPSGMEKFLNDMVNSMGQESD